MKTNCANRMPDGAPPASAAPNSSAPAKTSATSSSGPRAPLTPGSSPEGGLFEWSAGALHPLSVLPDGQPSSSGALGLNNQATRGAISTDGSRVAWSVTRRQRSPLPPPQCHRPPEHLRRLRRSRRRLHDPARRAHHRLRRLRRRPLPVHERRRLPRLLHRRTAAHRRLRRRASDKSRPLRMRDRRTEPRPPRLRPHRPHPGNRRRTPRTSRARSSAPPPTAPTSTSSPRASSPTTRSKTAPAPNRAQCRTSPTSTCSTKAPPPSSPPSPPKTVHDWFDVLRDTADPRHPQRPLPRLHVPGRPDRLRQPRRAPPASRSPRSTSTTPRPASSPAPPANPPAPARSASNTVRSNRAPEASSAAAATSGSNTASSPPTCPAGRQRTSRSAPIYQPRYLSDSGRLFFNSGDALAPSDSNGTQDVYQFEPPGVGGPTGCTEPCPPTASETAAASASISAGTSREESAFLDASETGDDVFLLTSSRLVPADVDSRPRRLRRPRLLGLLALPVRTPAAGACLPGRRLPAAGRATLRPDPRLADLQRRRQPLRMPQGQGQEARQVRQEAQGQEAPQKAQAPQQEGQ